ncbi:transmembrane protein [Babesia ovis]|uniref:Transmembrane protein n=1 Tax=Babesia ovis TaxID=5869 RepID=A0A9W5TDM6_BABOV|nr:transmembrane protein [Babesia ovis]
MSVIRALLPLLWACVAAIRCACVTGALNLTPAQVLLPSTSAYTHPAGSEPLQIQVQVLLRVEPRVCVSWEAQNPELLRLFLPNNEETNFGITPVASYGENCSSSIWAASIPRLLASPTAESLRSWVFAYDPSSHSRAGTEVVISPMRSIQFETRNRRIAVNQIATLKIVGHDEFNNTFTSLEGIPFEACIANPDIMDIIDPSNDPEVATRARVSLLDKRDRFAVSKGYVLTSDVIVLQGRTVGRTKISVRVMLPEYRQIVLEDVEFTVSDSIDLEPAGRLVVPPGVDFKFCVHKVKPQSVSDEVWDPKVDLSHYTWSTSGTHAGVSIRPDGTLKTGKSGGIDYKVILTDKRNLESYSTDVSVRVPESLQLSYGGLQNMLDCYSNKTNVPVATPTSGGMVGLMTQLQQQLFVGCRGSVRCGSRSLTASASGSKKAISTSPAYLLLGRSYIFDVAMRDKDGANVYVTDGTSFKWSLGKQGLVDISLSPNGRFAVVKALAEGSTTAVVELVNATVSIQFNLEVTNPVHLSDFPVEDVKLSVGSTSDTIVASKRPLVVPPNETVKLTARGGSGEYLWNVDTNLCSVKYGVLRCTSVGTTTLTLSDSLNPENIYKIQVVVGHIQRLEFVPTNAHVEAGTLVKMSLVGYTDLSLVKPVFSTSWSSVSPDASQFYHCLALTCQPGMDIATKPNCRVEHDRFMVELDNVGTMAFSCGSFVYRTLHPGDGNISVTLMHHDALSMPELTASAKVVIYDRLSLSLHPDYTHFPLKSIPQPYMSIQPSTADQAVLANVPIGGKVRLMVKGGPPVHMDGISVSICGKNNTATKTGTTTASIYIEKLRPDTGDPINQGRTMFDVYCLAETAGERICVSVDNVVRNEYVISCRLPSYLEIHPLVPVNNYGLKENLLYASGSPVSWEDSDISAGVFASGSALCYKNDAKTMWQVMTNAQNTHAFRAVVYDAFGVALCPTESYYITWGGSAIKASAQIPELSFQKIDGSVFIYENSDITPLDLVASLEWSESRHTSPGLSKALNTKAITALIASSKLWKPSAARKSSFVLESTLKVVPTLPHEILISSSKSTKASDKKVSIFFNPKARYQFAVALGTGNYHELSSYNDSIKLQQSNTTVFNSVAEFAKLVNVMEGVTNLFDPFSLQRSLGTKEGIHSLPVKYMNFLCQHPCSRTLEIVDRGQLGQVTKTLLLTEQPVAKLQIVISDLSDISPGSFEDFDALSTPQTGISILSVKRLYRLHAVALDADNNPISYPSLTGLKFSVCSNTLVKLEHPKDVGYSAIGSAMVIQCTAEGRYTIRAEIRNYGASSDVSGSLVSESIEITAYKETKPILASIMMLPNSGEFHLSMLDSALTRSFPSYTATLESSDQSVLHVLGAGQLGVIKSLKPGSCTLTSYIPTGAATPTKSVTPVIVAVPNSVTIYGPTQVTSQKTVVLQARLYDKQKRLFTPVFFQGASESPTHSHCIFTWAVLGHGVFIENGERVSSVAGTGFGRITLLATSAGSISVSLRVSCRNLGSHGTVELVSSKFTVEAMTPLDIFGTSTVSNPFVLAPNGTYESLAGLVEPVASSDPGLMVLDRTDGQVTLRTENKTGDLLLKTMDNNVTHVQVRSVDQIHIHPVGSVFSSEVHVFKSGNKQLLVDLKTKTGHDILSPTDLRLKFMLSNASLFRVVSLTGQVLNITANSSDGCSSLTLFLDDNDEQFNGSNLVYDCVRLCVVNALTPQVSKVVRGSSIRFVAGDANVFGIPLRASDVLRKYNNIESIQDIRLYQDAIASCLDSVFYDIRSDLNRALSNVFHEMGIVSTPTNCKDSLELHQPFLEITQYPGGTKASLIVQFSICRVDSVIFAGKLSTLLHEFGRTKGSIWSFMEGGIFPMNTSDSMGSSHDSNWFIDNIDTVIMRGSHAVAVGPGTAVVKYDGPHMKGDARISVVDTVSNVEYQHFGISTVNIPPFSTGVTFKEFNEAFYIVFKPTAAGDVLLSNSAQIDSNILALCHIVGSEPWLEKVFISEPSYYHVGGDYLPSCKVSLRRCGNRDEWSSFSTVLKSATESVNDVQLRTVLHSSMPSDVKLGGTTLGATSATDSLQQPLVSLRSIDTTLWDRSFKWKLPVFSQFVDSAGTPLEEITVEPTKPVVLSVYPCYSRCKLVLATSSHYKVRVTDRQGLLCTFVLENDGILEPSSLRLVCQRATAGIVNILPASGSEPITVSVGKSSFGVDILMLLFTLSVAVGLAYLIYALAHRPNSRYYETTEPIKLERRVPNVFEKLYQADYHGAGTSSTSQYQHRRRL